jgi:GNAT superfamily N-acetyltransferase
MVVAGAGKSQIEADVRRARCDERRCRCERHLGAFSPDREPDARRHGHAGALLEWLIEEGHWLGCDQLHLDSGIGPERFDAHRLYHNHGLAIYSHHFARGL